MAESKDIFLGAYLINGADLLKRDTVIERLRKRLAEKGDLSLNLEVFKGDQATGADIVDACNTLPFASPLRLVQVDDADKLKKDDAEQIVAYLKSPNPTTVLALVATKLAKNTRLYKGVVALGSKAVIDCSPMARRDLPAAVRSMAVGHGTPITPGAANALIDLVGEDTVQIDAQLQKLALAHRGSDPINESEVTAQVSRTAVVKPWDFVDAFSARNAKRCVMLRPYMKDTMPIPLLTMCVTRLRELIIAKSLAQRGQFGALSKMLGLPDWKVKNHMRWASGFSSNELYSALSSAVEADRMMKSGADPETALMMWVIEVCRKH